MVNKKLRLTLNVVCFLIFAFGVFQFNNDPKIFAICLLPFLINYIAQAILSGETSVSGAPEVIKKNEKPLLFKSIIIVFIIFFISDLLYLLFVFLL